MLKAHDTRREPLAVELVREALSERLGRPAASRAAKTGRGYWIVSDPCFAVLQRGPAGGRRDYRTGIAVRPDGIYFDLWYARGSAQLLRENLRRHPELIERAARATQELRRSDHFLAYGSRRESQAMGRGVARGVLRRILSDEWPAFQSQLRREAVEIADDLFPDLPSAGRVGTGESLRGYVFVLQLADRRALSASLPLADLDRNARRIVRGAWHLFSCLYPWEPTRARRADLRRALRAALGVGGCEYGVIRDAPRSPCDDSAVQAAHIIPYIRGGNDRPWNGLWLCGKHHRETEDRLAGRRYPGDLTRVAVRFVG